MKDARHWLLPQTNRVSPYNQGFLSIWLQFSQEKTLHTVAQKFDKNYIIQDIFLGVRFQNIRFRF